MLHHRLRCYGSGLLTISYISSVTSTTSTITAMSNINSGDLLVFFGFSFNNEVSIPNNVTPSGFTLISNHSDSYDPESYGRWVAYYKIANGTEDGSTLTGMSAYLDRKQLIQFRANSPISTVTPLDVTTVASSNTSISNVIYSEDTKLPSIIMAFYGTQFYPEGTPSITYSGESPTATISDTANRVLSKFTTKNVGESINNVNTSIYNNSNAEISGLIGFYLQLK